MKIIWTIFKKEWDRVIKDKRLVLTVMILPGLMIFLIYTFMGGALDQFTAEEPGTVAILNPTAGFETLYSTIAYGEDDNGDPIILFEEKAEIVTIGAAEMASYREKVDAGEWDLIIEFPAGLETSLSEDYHGTVSVYYNQNETQSSGVASRFIEYLTAYQEALSFAVHGDTSIFLVEPLGPELDQNRMIGELMAMLLPMLVVMFLFSGAMSIGPESIAGEKERGTMATLLITPVKRSQIALGKVMSLSVLSLISALSSFIGIISSLPKMIGLENVEIPYGLGEYALILVLLFSTVFVIVGIIAVVSAYAKNLKEAGTLIMPFYMVTIFVGITSMFGDGAISGWWFYLIPIYNTVQSLTAILVFDPLSSLYVLLTVLSNLFVTALLVWVLDRMFKSERIMFAK